MKAVLKDFADLIQDSARLPEGWRLQILINDDNLTYFAANDVSKEWIIVDPVREDWDDLLDAAKKFKDYRLLLVTDTHTHADHVTCGAELARELGTSYWMHQKSPSSKVQVRVSRDFVLSTVAGPMRFVETPGHTVDGMTIFWGPFIFAGDTLMYGDTGRDDLPGGNPEEHYESMQKIKEFANLDSVVLPGHDGRGGRISTWKTQLEVNTSLTQDRATFVAEAGAFSGPAPKKLKESLFENCK